MANPNNRDPDQLSLASGEQRAAQSVNARSAPKRTKLISRETRDDPFPDRFEFADDVHGDVRVNVIERDAVDTPEFQRLFRLSQLGFVDLVYPTANHTRGVHSIGACSWAKRLTRCLIDNNTKFQSEHGEPKLQITRVESVLISLAALLHDIPHGPFSHDIEKKTHIIYLDKARKSPTKVKSYYGLYEKHDNFASNPALYLFLIDTERSLLARVLQHHSPLFADLLLEEGAQSSHLERFVEQLRSTDWPRMKQELLPQLLFHLLVYEKPAEAENYSFSLKTSFHSSSPTEWGLGPKANWRSLHESWYQPFRHDIVGDTLSADLLDYLMRDQARLGMKNGLDFKLLEYYTLVSAGNEGQDSTSLITSDPLIPSSTNKKLYRCAIDLDDHKRGTFRAERLNDIFRLLDLRHQIHEKAVFHRVVQSAVAMLSRAGLILQNAKPSLESLYGFDSPTPALAGDDHFLQLLVNAAKAENAGADSTEVHQSLPCKLSERRVYRPLMVIPGDRIELLLRDLGNFKASLEHPLRELAAIVDSTFFSSFFLLLSTYIERFLQHAFENEDDLNNHISQLATSDQNRLDRVLKAVPKRVIFWTSPYKQLYKDPAILVRAQGLIATIDSLQNDERVSEALRSRVKAGLNDAETKNEGLWKLYVFLSDGLFYTGVLAQALNRHPCAADPLHHKSHLEAAQRIAVRALRAAWAYWLLKKKEINLEKVADAATLKELLGLFTSGRIAFDLGCRDISGLVSAVKVDQYLHGHDVSNCRDIRYKFDKDGDVNHSLEAIADETQREMVRQAVRSLALNGLRSEEFGELVQRLAAMPDLQGFVQGVASRNSPVVDGKLRSLWLRELE